MTQQINYLFNNSKWGGFPEFHITDPWIHKYIKVSGSLVFLFYCGHHYIILLSLIVTYVTFYLAGR